MDDFEKSLHELERQVDEATIEEYDSLVKTLEQGFDHIAALIAYGVAALPEGTEIPDAFKHAYELAESLSNVNGGNDVD